MFTYDLMDGLSRVDYPDGNYVSYSYDNACRLTKVTTPFGSTSYEYDLLDRITRVVDRNGYKPEDLPFTGNGMSGGIETDCVTPEYEFLQTADNKVGVYDIKGGAELYIVTQDGEEILIAIYDADEYNPKHPEASGRFVRLEDIKNDKTK